VETMEEILAVKGLDMVQWYTRAPAPAYPSVRAIIVCAPETCVRHFRLGYGVAILFQWLKKNETTGKIDVKRQKVACVQ
jgi:hypothetical protein